MAKKTTSNDATVQTLTVEVKTVLIGNRQMTWNFYRQVPSAPLVASDNKLRGEVWGQLSACHQEKVCDNRCEHLHLLWELAGELHRDCLYCDCGRYPPIRERSSSVVDLRSDIYDLALAADALCVLTVPTQIRYVKSPERTLTTPAGTRKFKEWYYEDSLEKALFYYLEYSHHDQHELQQALALRWPQLRSPSFDLLTSIQGDLSAMRETHTAERGLLEASKLAWPSLYSQLASIPQIYIVT